MKYLDQKQFEEANMFKTGNLNVSFAQYFIGNSYLNPLNDQAIAMFNVTFEPGCRNNWHIHESTKGGGQILICTCGEGWYQEEGKEAVELKEGTVVYIAPGIKHFHGAKVDSYFSHIAVEIPGENCKNIWLEEVDDDYYNNL